jgi:hypothetical protein
MKSNPLSCLLYDELDYREARVKDFIVLPTTIQQVRDFVENWHYSGNVNGLRISHVFGLFYDSNLIGAMIYGPLGMANTWKKYADSEKEVIELRRLCCIDNTPKNTESYFIGKTLRWLKKNTNYKVVVSYADTFHNHQGTIYKASNFEYGGLTAKGRIIECDGRIYHDKCIRTYHVDKEGNKKLKPFAQKVKEALENGTAKYVETPGKHIFLYSLK